jgi:hypothetical protein
MAIADGKDAGDAYLAISLLKDFDLPAKDVDPRAVQVLATKLENHRVN